MSFGDHKCPTLSPVAYGFCLASMNSGSGQYLCFSPSHSLPLYLFHEKIGGFPDLPTLANIFQLVPVRGLELPTTYSCVPGMWMGFSRYCCCYLNRCLTLSTGTCVRFFRSFPPGGGLCKRDGKRVRILLCLRLSRILKYDASPLLAFKNCE